MPDAPDSTTTIHLDGRTLRFFQGVSAGQRVRDAHEAVTVGKPVQTRRDLFWFYVGALAGGEFGCTEADEFAQIIAGASTRAPDVADEGVDA